MVLAVAVATLLPLGMLPAVAATGPTANQNPAVASALERSSPQQTPPALQAAIEKAKLTASDAYGGDSFGNAVAVDGDTAVVGAVGVRVHGASNAGAAYVFVRVGSAWVQQAKLFASDGTQYDAFGDSVAVDGDTAVIGAPDGVGEAYVFVRSGSTWTERARLVCRCGSSVAVDKGTVAVGAPYAFAGHGPATGAVYVFVPSGPGWTLQSELTEPDAHHGNSFGQSVVLDRDTAVIGAPGANVGKGAAYLFVRAGSSWTLQAELTAADRRAGDYFGNSVALDGDTTVIGAHGDDSVTGSAYVFVRAGTAWTQQAKLTASDRGYDEFGWAVAVSGRIALVGTRIGSGPGAAYTFLRSGIAWAQQAKLTSTDNSDQFGYSVAMNGDTAVVGAVFGDSISTSDTGAAYVFGL